MEHVEPKAREQGEKEENLVAKEEDTLFTVGLGRAPAMVEMEIMGYKLSNTITNGGSRVNVLSEDTWKAIGKPTLWPPKFQLVGADQHSIKPIGTLIGQKIIIGTQQFILDFVVITLEKKGYDALLGRGWLVVARATHNRKRNTLTIESEGRKYTIDLKN